MSFAAWRRVPEAGACDFCLMLATRGAVYRTAQTAGDGNDYHRHCRCDAALETDFNAREDVYIDPADANRKIAFRNQKTKRTYRYDLSKYKLRNPPEVPAQSPVRVPDLPAFDPTDVPRFGQAKVPAGAERWVDALTPDEREALARYTGKSGDLAAEEINYRLRLGHPLTTEQERSVALIDSAIKKAEGLVDVDTPLYRGIERYIPQGERLFLNEEQVFEKVADGVVRDFPVGSRIKLGDGAFASTSTDVTPALDASVSRDAPGVIFEIAPTPGAPLQALTKFDDEYEVLLGRDVTFEVVNIIRRVEFVDSGGDSRYRTVIQVRRVSKRKR